MPRTVITAAEAAAAIYDATERPEVPLSEAPPGRALHELEPTHQQLALVGLEGLAAQIEAKASTFRAGSPGYHQMHHLLGFVVTAAAALRRHLAQGGG